jgi:small subunit ribosomal protein S18
MPRNKLRKKIKEGRPKNQAVEYRTPRPKPKIDFGIEALDFKNATLLRQFVTDQGRMLPRKYTGMPAAYQRRLSREIKRARHMLLMK